MSALLPLLYDMAQFVSEQPSPAPGIGGILPFGECDVPALSKGAGLQGMRGKRSALIGMDTNLAELMAEPGLEKR
jgi:hypothetical protein